MDLLRPNAALCSQAALRIALAVAAFAPLQGCALHHTAPVASRPLPPPPGAHVVHRGRLIVVLDPDTKQTQCARTEQYRAVCFEGVRTSLGNLLEQAFWPSFRETQLGEAEEAKPEDYVLVVGAELETLPPDQDGPGWSVGVKAHYRLMYDEHTLLTESLASRSRADFAYGAPLAAGASDTLAAISYYIGGRVCQTAEPSPEPPPALPAVASRPNTEPRPRPQ